MISRREWLGRSIGAGAALALTPELLHALEGFQQQGGKLMQRAIPSSGEMLPVISFAPRPTGPSGPGPIQPAPTDVPVAKEVLRSFLDNGGRVVDVLHGGPVGEQAARTAANELGIQNRFFWTAPASIPLIPTLPGVPQPKPDAATVRAGVEEKFTAFKVPKIDLVMVGAGADPIVYSVLREMKKEGRVRYIGVHTLLPPANLPIGAPGRQLESIMSTEAIDFVATDYSLGDRRVEERILPLAQERKIAFMAYFPFDRRRIFERASSTPLPAWAAEFDAKTWAQFFLKYVLSHPAVIVARTGTTNAAHMVDNIGGGIGRLPNEAMRQRMRELVDSFPPTPTPALPPQLNPANQPPPAAVSTAILDRYVGEYRHAAIGTIVTIRRDGDRLLMKIQGPVPEAPLVPRSETRFATSLPGATLEFQLDGQGRVTGAVFENPVNRIPLERR